MAVSHGERAPMVPSHPRLTWRPPTRVDRHIDVLAAVLFALIVFGCMPDVAGALSMRSVPRDCLDSVSLAVDIASTDPTGTALLSIDGTVVDSRPVTPGSSVDYPRFDLEDGRHRASVILRTRTQLLGTPVVEFTVWSKPEKAALVTPETYAAGYTYASARVGAGTETLSLYVDGVLAHRREVKPGTVASMGGFTVDSESVKVELVASNPVASNRSTFTVKRLVYPWPTCIIVDKSDFRLYWIRDGVLVKAYPIAVGKAHTPTPAAIWRIDAKYYSDPSGVYGPRKMRLFRQYGSGYTYTSYLIHGTNEPWVIGSMASHGCIRMNNNDVLELYPQVPLGTMVLTRE